jgi:hypothetical protein
MSQFPTLEEFEALQREAMRKCDEWLADAYARAFWDAMLASSKRSDATNEPKRQS